MQSANIVYKYFSNDRSSRLKLMISQVDALAELAASVAAADYAALFFRTSGKLRPVAYHGAQDLKITSPEAIDAAWTFETNNYFAGKVGEKDFNSHDLSSGADNFATGNSLGFSLAVPTFAGEIVESVCVLYWREQPAETAAKISAAISAVAKSLSGTMKAVEEVTRLCDYSLKLSRLMELLEIPIAEYRFKDFLSELIRRAHSILGAAGICLYKYDIRNGKYSLQEVASDRNADADFIRSLTRALSEEFDNVDDSLLGHHEPHDLTDRIDGRPFSVAGLEIFPEKFFRYEILIWQDIAVGFTQSDRDMFSVLSVLCESIMRNAILIRHAKKARRIMERNASLMADMETTAALADMTSGVAHEFNNIIGGVIGRLQLIKMKQQDSTLLDQLDQIEKMIMEGARTVRSIQEYTVGAEYKNLSPVDLNEVIREAVAGSEAVWRSLAESKSISVISNLEADEAVISGNAEDLTTVIDKIMLNAVEASPDNSTVNVVLQTTGPKVRLTIADNGPGIPTAQKAKVFYPFFSSKQDRLSGLGLSVAHGIVTRHKGKITIKDNQPKGAIIEIDFTLINENTDLSEITNRHRAKTNLQILVVDDDLQIREVLRDMLSMKGHIPTTCADGYAALDALSKQEFDLVITDLGMPGISGMDLARQAHEANPDLPIAMITGWGSQLDKKEAENTGIKAILPKPFHLKEVQSLVEELV